MTRPRISVVTATLDALPGLRATVSSVESQDYANVEHIVVDGQSTDGTPEWLAGRSDITSVSEPDHGIADALNKGISLATGEWVLVLHSEDTLVDRSALARAAGHLETSADLVSFDVLFASSSGDRVRKSRGLSYWTNFKSTAPHQGLFSRRSLFDRLGGFDTRFRVAMDYEFLLRSLRAGVGADVVNDVLSRMPDTGVSSRADWASLRSRFAEEKLAHDIHSSGRALGAIYAAYWPPYLAYRKVKSVLPARVRSS